MNTLRSLSLAALALGVAFLAPAQPAPGVNIPLIVMDDVPLTDAIKNLARQADINFILDPRVSAMHQPTVTARWENVTAEDALKTVLKNYNLVMVDSPATLVSRIAPDKPPVKPVPASQVRAGTTNIVPVIAMDGLSLDAAVQVLAKQAKLNVALDPKIAKDSGSVLVSIRWEKISASQALAALLDNYNLELIEDPASSIARIAPKAAATAKPSNPPEPGK